MMVNRPAHTRRHLRRWPIGGWIVVAVLLGCGGVRTARRVPHTENGARPTANHPLHGRAFDLRSGRPLDRETLVRLLRGTRFVLIGERHDNPEHHRIQAWLLDGLVRSGRRPAVAWEMITRDERDQLGRYLASNGASPAGLGPAVRWEERGWPRWTTYEPIARVALAARLPMVAAGVSRRALFAEEHAERADHAPLPDLPQPQRAALARTIRAAHCGHANDALVELMVRAQQRRDATMASRLFGEAPPGGAVLIAGNEHVRRDRGVPFYLTRVHGVSARDVLSVGLVEVEPGALELGSYRDLFARASGPAYDVVWFSERIDHEDPCVRYRRSLQRMRKKRGSKQRTSDEVQLKSLIHYSDRARRSHWNHRREARRAPTVGKQPTSDKACDFKGEPRDGRGSESSS